ncbi:hypothetical protein [Parasitella parasitica]|uniref:SH3 domain-containing protein n=1 Tax=Parasitella parasitica TaxID=35722 RepID=A0A0B7MSQ7_9FUNG|nr:hypothetical protein [Parasitella parasitica]
MNNSGDYYHDPKYYAQYYSQQHKNVPSQQGIEHKFPPIFETMEKLVLTCNGFAHALESTLVATHSGFRALIQLTHQYRTVKRFVGRMSSIFSVLSWLRNKLARNKKLTLFTKFSVEEFESYNKSSSKLSSWTTLLALSIGVSLVMHLHQTKKKIQHKEIVKQTKSCALSKSKTPPPPNIASKMTKIDFARALYSFHAESSDELTLQPNDLVAILSKEDEDWWQGRLKNGKIGYFPANHVEIIEKKPSQQNAP